MSVREVFDSIMDDWRDIDAHAPVLTYNDFEEFIEVYTSVNDSSYPFRFEETKRFDPYILLLHFSTAYNNFFFILMSQKLKGDEIYPAGKFKLDRHPLSDLIILQLWKQKVLLVDNISRSFCLGREFQTYQQLRTYLEACQLLFLILTDQTAFNEYMDSDTDPVEYQKRWWKKLAPAKIRKRLKSNKQEAEEEERRTGILYGDIRKSEPGGNFEHMLSLVEYCNDYIHWKSDTLLAHAACREKGGFRVSSTNDWSDHCNQTLVFLIEAITHSTIWLEHALSIHTTVIAHSKESEQKYQQVQFLHSLLATRCAYKGLYDFVSQNSSITS